MSFQLLYHCELAGVQLPEGGDHPTPRVCNEHTRQTQSNNGHQRPCPPAGTEGGLKVEADRRNEKRMNRQEEGVDRLPSCNQPLGCLHQHAVLLEQQALSISIEISPCVIERIFQVRVSNRTHLTASAHSMPFTAAKRRIPIPLSWSALGTTTGKGTSVKARTGLPSATAASISQLTGSLRYVSSPTRHATASQAAIFSQASWRQFSLNPFRTEQSSKAATAFSSYKNCRNRRVRRSSSVA